MTRSTDTFFEDDFARADSATIGNNWTAEGDLQIINQVVKQSNGSGFAQTVELYQSAATAADHLAEDFATQVKVSCADDAESRSVDLLVRFDVDATDGYIVGLVWDGSGGSESLTLRIRKVTGGSATTLASADVTTEANTLSSSYDDQIQVLGARVEDDEDGVRLEAFFNDEERPRLTYTDNAAPVWKDAGDVGVRINEGATAATGQISVSYFAVKGIQDEIAETDFVATYWTFGRLVEMAKTESTRDSQTAIDDEVFRVWVNECCQEMFEYADRPKWASRNVTFITRSGTEDYELPADLISIGDVVQDVDQQDPLEIVEYQQFRRGNATTSSGRPYVFMRIGRGPNGGILLRAYPKPSGQYEYEVNGYGAPRWMTQDSDIPDVPHDLCHYLYWGAVMRYSLRDSDRTKIRASSQMWSEGLRRARRQARRPGQQSDKFRIRSGLGRTPWNDYEWSKYGIRR